jgi:RloB-like protein
VKNRHAPPAKRSPGNQPQRRIVKLLTEGRLTEVEYFSKWASLYRERVTVDIDDTHGSPMTLVKRAVQLVDQRKRAIRRGRTNAPFDEIWCVFDCDEHPYVQEAIALAELHQIGVAFSNPCFELWLVLHATDLWRHTERHAVQVMSATLGFTIGKGLGPDAWPKLLADWEDAESRSLALDARHDGNGSPAGSNPSTSVAQIVRSLRREQASD